MQIICKCFSHWHFATLCDQRAEFEKLNLMSCGWARHSKTQRKWPWTWLCQFMRKCSTLRMRPILPNQPKGLHAAGSWLGLLVGQATQVVSSSPPHVFFQRQLVLWYLCLISWAYLFWPFVALLNQAEVQFLSLKKAPARQRKFTLTFADTVSHAKCVKFAQRWRCLRWSSWNCRVQRFLSASFLYHFLSAQSNNIQRTQSDHVTWV